MKIIDNCIHHTVSDKDNFRHNGNKWYDRTLEDWAVFFNVPTDTFLRMVDCFNKLEYVANNTKTYSAAAPDIIDTLNKIRFNYNQMTEAIITKREVPPRLMETIEDFDNYWDLWDTLTAPQQEQIKNLYHKGVKNNV